ncbi:MAG: hypothetical protein JXM70_13080 [Pirellulales bacterium]|nr:hypothetical protein [Pirellulales bacterium]
MIYDTRLEGVPMSITASSDPCFATLTYRYRVSSFTPWGGSLSASGPAPRVNFSTIELTSSGPHINHVKTAVEGGNLNPLVNPGYTGYYTSILTPREVIVSPTLDYAFVADWELALLYGFAGERGDKVGVVRDPFGINGDPTYLGSTTPIDSAFVTSVTLSGDGSRLFAAYSGMGEVLVMDTSQLTATAEAQILDPYLAERTPIDIANPGVHITPLTVGGRLQGLSTQVGLPVHSLESHQSQITLTWEVDRSDIGNAPVVCTVYVSLLPDGEGLFPDDISVDGFEDGNPNRILTYELPADTITTDFEFIIPDYIELTPNQTYYWGVIAEGGGLTGREWHELKTNPLDPAPTPYPSVTILTHGFQPMPIIGDPLYQQPEGFITLAHMIAESGGDGHVLRYNRETGKWVEDITLEDGAGALEDGKPVVLVLDWNKESNISDSGFAEAAADASFAAMVQLDAELGGKLFASPMHFIGHSRGTVVNSEIVQRVGTYMPEIDNIHVTTLDPHDFNQPSLDVSGADITTLAATRAGGPVLGMLAAMIVDSGDMATTFLHYADFKDPDVERWSNIAFFDNYYQEVANPYGFTLTPNGRAIEGADINRQLDDRAGFTEDDLVAGTHGRVTSWYAGTVDLNTREFGDDYIYRTLSDKDYTKELGGVMVLEYNDVPWYLANERDELMPDFGDEDAIWEGIMEGWYWSVLGGGFQFGGGTSVDVFVDNTEPDHADTPARLQAVPTVFNGDFESGTLHIGQHMPPVDQVDNIPGWSFHGGSVNTAPLAVPTDYLHEQDGNHFLELSYLSSQIMHNRLYVPEDVSTLKVSLQVKKGVDSSMLEVEITDAATGVSYFVGSLLTEDDTDGFTTYYLPFSDPVRAAVLGKTCTLTLRLKDPGLTSEVYIDNVSLSVLKFEDTSGNETDLAALFIDYDPREVEVGTPIHTQVVAADTGGPYVERTAGTNKLGTDEIAEVERVNQHKITIRNTSDQPVDIELWADPNSFLIFKDPGGGDIGLFDSPDPIRFHETTIPAHGFVELEFVGILPDTFFDRINNGSLDMQRTELTLLDASVRVNRLKPLPGGAGNQVIPEGRYDFFYMPDITDSDRDDAVINFGRTREDQERSIRVDHPTGTRFEITQNAGAGFSIGDDSDLFQQRSWLVFTADAQADFPTAELEIYHNGRHLTEDMPTAGVNVNLMLKAQSVEKMELLVPLEDMCTAIEDVYYNHANFLDPAWNKMQTAFQSASNDNVAKTLDSALLDQFQVGIMTVYDQIYGQFDNAGIIDMDDAAAGGSNVTIDDSLGGGTLGLGTFDFAWNSYDTLLLDRRADFDWDPRYLEQRTIQPNLTPASKLYRLREITNFDSRDIVYTLWSSLTAQEVCGLGYLAATPDDFGYFFGRIMCHETGHTFGFYDEYVANTKVYYSPTGAWVRRYNLMGQHGDDPGIADLKNKVGSINDYQFITLALAFDDPQQQAREFQFTSGSSKFNDSPADVIDGLIEYIRMLDVLDQWNYPGARGGGTLPLLADDSFNSVRVDNIIDEDAVVTTSDTPEENPVVSTQPESTGGVPVLSGSPSSPSLDVTNGTFDVADPLDAGFGWTTSGSAYVDAGRAVLDEASDFFTSFSQSFIIPDDIETLQFSIYDLSLGATTAHPLDAFEVALLDSGTMTPVVGPVDGLSMTDAFLNIQHSGEIFFGPEVVNPGVATSGNIGAVTLPWTVQVDISGVAAGTEVTLYFDLLGFGDLDSHVVIDDVLLIGPNSPPTDIVLDNSSVDENLPGGVIGVLSVADPDPYDMHTFALSDPRFEVVGNTLKLLDTVSLDHETEPVVPIEITATDVGGLSYAETFLIDVNDLIEQGPTASLVSPLSGQVVSVDPGYITLQWTDASQAGLDPASIGIDDVSITGVTVDEIQDLGGGTVQYRYDLDGDTLQEGEVIVAWAAGAVSDLYGNPSVDGSDSFVFSLTNVLNPVAEKDDGEWGYRQRGIWQIEQGDGWQNDYRTQIPGTGAEYAMWMLQVPPGQYEVFATWPADEANAVDAPYRILDSNITRGTVSVNQTVAPDDGSYDGVIWESLGVYSFDSGIAAVELTNLAGGTVVADAIILVPPQPSPGGNDLLYMPGDANGDGVVDVSDLGILAAHYGTGNGVQWSDGDFNNDDQVDVCDLGILAMTYGSVMSYASTEPEVEPQLSAAQTLPNDTVVKASEPATVPGDLDNDGQVGLGDLAFFSSVYGQQPGVTTENPYAYAADFDGSGTVDLGDLGIFSSYYGQGRMENSIVRPTNVVQSVAVTPRTALTAAKVATEYINEKVANDDIAILAQQWMIAMEEMDDDNERNAIFAEVGDADDMLGLLEE